MTIIKVQGYQVEAAKALLDIDKKTKQKSHPLTIAIANAKKKIDTSLAENITQYVLDEHAYDDQYLYNGF